MTDDKMELAIAGIDPATGRCVMVAIDTIQGWLDARNDGLIVVPITREMAALVFRQQVPDVRAIARVPTP